MGKRKPAKQLDADDLIFPKGTLEADLLIELEKAPKELRKAARIVFDEVFPGPQVIETRKGPDHPRRDAEGNVADKSEVSR